jgi:hypothetical protein
MLSCHSLLEHAIETGWGRLLPEAHARAVQEVETVHLTKCSLPRLFLQTGQLSLWSSRRLLASSLSSTAFFLRSTALWKPQPAGSSRCASSKLPQRRSAAAWSSRRLITSGQFIGEVHFILPSPSLAARLSALTFLWASLTEERGPWLSHEKPESRSCLEVYEALARFR